MLESWDARLRDSSCRGLTPAPFWGDAAPGRDGDGRGALPRAHDARLGEFRRAVRKALARGRAKRPFAPGDLDVWCHLLLRPHALRWGFDEAEQLRLIGVLRGMLAPRSNRESRAP